ncbi:MAG TPA: glycosyltransferase [Vicinamibacterales bacterium]|nr:glycosyltransferase [Vicinamibacterales bacterium]
MIRILHVITDLDIGGSETALLRLISRLDPQRFSCSVVSLTGPGKLAARIAEAGVPVTNLVQRRGMNPALVWRLARVIRKWRPTILQTWLYHADLLGTLCGWALGTPVVCWNIRCAELDWNDHPRSLFWTVRMLATLSRFPDAVVVNSTAGRAAHEALGYRPRRWELIPNGFDAAALRPPDSARATVRAALGIPPDVPLVGLIARWHPMKDHATFVRAAARMAADHPMTHFLMAGRGIDDGNAALVRLVREHGVAARTHLMGETDRPLEALAAVDVAVSSSYGEAFPNVLGEAMSCGVPVVTTDAGDSARVVGDTAAVVPPRDPAALAAAVLRILSLSPEERRAMGRRARERLMRQYSLDHIVRRYEELYVDLAQRAAVS